MTAVERIQAASDFEGVVVGLMATDVSKMAWAYLSALHDLGNARRANEGVEAAAATVAKVARRTHAAISGNDGLSRFAYQLGGEGSPDMASQVERMGIPKHAGYEIGLAVRDLFASRIGNYNDADSINERLEDALTLVSVLGGPPELSQAASTEIDLHFRELLKRARKNDADKALTEFSASIDPDGGAAEVGRLIDKVKELTEGMTPDEVDAFMRSGGLFEIDRAAYRVGRAMMRDIGPGKLPAALAAATEKVRPQEVVVGKLRAAGADEFKALYVTKFNAAMGAVRATVQAELDQAMRQMIRDLQAKHPNWGQDVDTFRVYESEKKQAQQEIYDRLLAKQKADAAAAVAREAGIAPEELQAKIDSIERMAHDLVEERARAGEAILAEIRKLGIPRDEAVQLKARKVRVDNSAARLMGATYDARVTELMQLIGGGVTDAGPVEIMGISALKKKHPALYRGKGIKRAFCSWGYRKTASGGDDIGVIGMGTESRDITTLWHEMGHWLEHNNPVVRGMVKAWFKRRTDGEKAVRLKSLFPHCSYGSKEITLRDNFLHPYMGKVYESGSTEIVSMGLEYLSDPAKAAELATKDPDMMALLVKIIEVVNANR